MFFVCNLVIIAGEVFLNMTHRPWHVIGIFVSVVFVASMFFGYYQCRYSEKCTAPFVSIGSLSQDELKSELTGSKNKLTALRQRLLDKKDKAIVPAEKTILKPSLDVGGNGNMKGEDSVSQNLYYELVPDKHFSPNVTVVSAGGNGVEKAHLDLIRLALYPFHEMLKNIHLTIYVGYQQDMYGKGIRAFASQYGKVVNIIAPTAYSFRLISPREWIAILRHEIIHVLHDQYLSSSDRKEVEKIALKNGKVIPGICPSDYCNADEYEFLAEVGGAFLYMNAKELVSENALLKDVYGFFKKRFNVDHFDERRDPYVLNWSKISKDTTRIFKEYPLPEFTL